MANTNTLLIKNEKLKKNNRKLIIETDNETEKIELNKKLISISKSDIQDNTINNLSEKELKQNTISNISQDKMTDGIPQFTTINTDYGEVLHSTILKIFGDELTYNELEFYTRDKNATSYLEVKEERNNHEGFMFISVFVDKQKIMEKKYDVNWSCDMFNYLSELENEEEEEEEVKCMRGCGNPVIKNPANEDGCGYTCNSCLKEEEEYNDMMCDGLENIDKEALADYKKAIVEEEEEEKKIEIERTEQLRKTLKQMEEYAQNRVFLCDEEKEAVEIQLNELKALIEVEERTGRECYINSAGEIVEEKEEEEKEEEEDDSEYMNELIECVMCNEDKPKKKMYWNSYGYTDTCERCYQREECGFADCEGCEVMMPKDMIGENGYCLDCDGEEKYLCNNCGHHFEDEDDWEKNCDEFGCQECSKGYVKTAWVTTRRN